MIVFFAIILASKFFVVDTRMYLWFVIALFGCLAGEILADKLNNIFIRVLENKEKG